MRRRFIQAAHSASLSRRLIAVLSLALCVGSGGCSVFMAANQNEHKDLDVLKAGHLRREVLAELGQPTASEMRSGHRVDIFSFVQGQNGWFNGARAVGHGVADVFTLGLWEIAGTPTEMALKGKKLAFEVYYDSADRVDKVIPIKT